MVKILSLSDFAFPFDSHGSSLHFYPLLQLFDSLSFICILSATLFCCSRCCYETTASGQAKLRSSSCKILLLIIPQTILIYQKFTDTEYSGRILNCYPAVKLRPIVNTGWSGLKLASDSLQIPLVLSTLTTVMRGAALWKGHR